MLLVYLLISSIPIVSSVLTVRFDPPNGTVIPSSSSLFIESLGSTHLCITTTQNIIPQCKTGINATNGCIFGCTQINAESVTITTTSENKARVSVVGCINKTETSIVSTAEYDISAASGIVTFSPLPSSGNVKIGSKITMSSSKSTYLCVTEDSTTPTCTNSDTPTCGIGEIHLGSTTELIIKDGLVFAGRGCTTNIQGSSDTVRVEYTMGPIAAAPTFQIIGDYLNTSIKQETIIVRNNAKIRAVSNSSVIVCMKSYLLSSDDDSTTTTTTTPTVLVPPTCNQENATCGIGSSSNDIVIDNTIVTIVKAIGCASASEAGTNSNIVTNQYKIGKIVQPVEAFPSKKGKLQEFSTISLTSTNADNVCWSTDVNFGPSDTLCKSDGSGCVENAILASSTTMPNITRSNVPMTIKVEGCTSIDAMGVTSKSTLGPYDIGAVAGKPKMTVITDQEEESVTVTTDVSSSNNGNQNMNMIKSGDSIQINSVDAMSICWTKWVGNVLKADEDEPILKAPVCSNDGMSCIEGTKSDRTPSSLTQGANALRLFKLSAIGCTNTSPGTGGGKHSIVTTSSYIIVPTLQTPTFTPDTGTQFKNSQGSIAMAGNKATGGICYVLQKMAEVTTTATTAATTDTTDTTTSTSSSDSVITCPIQPPECRTNPKEGEAKCISGTHMDLTATPTPTLPVTEDMNVCAIACSHSSQIGTHSRVNVGTYFVLKGDTTQLKVLETIYNDMHGKSGAWIYDWDLDSYYCDLDGIECDVCKKDDSPSQPIQKKCLESNNIINLNMAYVGLIGKTVDLSPLKHLNELSLAGNQITGPLPSLDSFTKLTSLKLFFNQYDGTLPENIGDMTSLIELDLDHNQLSGSIPVSISKLINLKSLDLSHNSFSGPIPPEIGELIHLTKLDLSNNNFEGDIPESFGNLTKLVKLNLDSNPKLNIVLSDEVCDRTKQCMPVTDIDGAPERMHLITISLSVVLCSWWLIEH